MFLDLDGTLLDIAERPDAVVVPRGLPALLARVERALGGAIAIVSGRSLDTVDALLDPWRPVAACEHGAECRLPSGGIVNPQSPPVPEDWRTRLSALAVEMPGVIVENKHSAITMHYRRAPQWRERLHDIAEQLVAPRADAFAVTPAHQAVEIRPRGIDKGRAVRLLMREPLFLGRVPVFVGDDVTDEDGIDAARELGGWGLNVSECFPDGPAGVRQWIVALAGRLGAS
ncbi:MAG: trehalose-phosphatase [Alphaproteobacteria bacterium]|nr:trehalose-phosphatase [Alphaproteobacteria bacterium]